MTEGNILSTPGAVRYFTERSEVLGALLSVLDGLDHWSIDHEGSPVDTVLLEIGEALQAGLELEITDPIPDSLIEAMSYLRTSRSILIIHLIGVSNRHFWAQLINAIEEGRDTSPEAHVVWQRMAILAQFDFLTQVFMPERVDVMVDVLESLYE